MLKVPKDFVINYYLCITPEQVGNFYGDNSSCNVFNRLPNNVYAVYSDEIKCVGFHEDAHLISYHYMARPNCNFLREGLAMFFDKTWDGRQNVECVRDYLLNNPLPKLSSLFENDIFFSYECDITYLLSGAFTDYLIKNFGIDLYKRMYSDYDKLGLEIFERYIQNSITKLEKEFYDYIHTDNPLSV